MATNTFSRENLLTAARMTANQEIIDVAEVLNETNEVIQDAHVERANEMTSHVVSRRTALPTVTWVKVGNGWTATTGLVQQARETIGQMKSRYQCPQDVMRIQPNPDKYRSQQERPHIESMGQEFANTLFYGGINPATGTLAPIPEEFDGLSTRLTALLTTNTTRYVANNGDSSASDDTSMWFIQWGPGKVYLVYPRNTSQAGITKEDKGLVFTAGDNSQNLWAYITEFAWDVGLVVEDGRALKRLANISTTSGDAWTLNEDRIIETINDFEGTTPIDIYCNKTIFTQLQILAKDKTNVHWGPEDPFGRPQLMFLNSRLRRCDAIRSDEASLTA